MGGAIGVDVAHHLGPRVGEGDGGTYGKEGHHRHEAGDAKAGGSHGTLFQFGLRG
jgi:hypothetical protein